MIDYLYIPVLPYGKERRAIIKQWFDTHTEGRYRVNCKYRPQMKHDPDLKKLVRIGFLKTKREWESRTHRKTYLVKA
jgi:hypothetical protein